MIKLKSNQIFKLTLGYKSKGVGYYQDSALTKKIKTSRNPDSSKKLDST